MIRSFALMLFLLAAMPVGAQEVKAPSTQETYRWGFFFECGMLDKRQPFRIADMPIETVAVTVNYLEGRLKQDDFLLYWGKNHPDLMNFANDVVKLCIPTI